MKRAARLALACYPPSWKDRYGEELAEVTGDGSGATLDLLVGAARAWTRPAGPRTLEASRLRAVGTVHVSWCFGFVASLVYVQAVNDPPLPGLTTGASQPLWGLLKASFFVGWAVVVLVGTALLLRIGGPAVRRRDWHVLRPMLPAAALLVVVLGTIPVVGSYGNQAPSLGPVLVILTWLALGLALVLAGAIGPVLSLQRSPLRGSALRVPTVAAVGVTAAAVVLAVAALAQAAVLSSRASAWDLLLMWGAVTGLALAAGTSTVSVRRALRVS